jgi:hypothetical protein
MSIAPRRRLIQVGGLPAPFDSAQGRLLKPCPSANGARPGSTGHWRAFGQVLRTADPSTRRDLRRASLARDDNPLISALVRQGFDAGELLAFKKF